MNILKLSPVKREIAELLLAGNSKTKSVSIIAKRRNVTEEQRAYSTYKSYVTMVDNAIKEFQKTQGESVADKKAVKPLQDFTKGDGKNRVKNRLVDELLYSEVKNGTILTLSSHQCDTEKRINKESSLKGFQFISCECDVNTYNKLNENIKKEKMTFMKAALFCEIGTILKISGQDKFSHLFLDYCDTLKKFASEIEMSIKNNVVVKGGLIWITVSSRKGEGVTKTELQKLVKNVGGSNYKINYTDSYKDTSPMVTMIVQRLK